MAKRNISGSCFLVGLGTGIALTVLFVPHSGRATRRFIRRKAQDGTDILKNKAALGREYIEQNCAIEPTRWWDEAKTRWRSLSASPS